MNINLNKHLGNLIRSKRKYCGYSTQELADKIGISAGSINNIENADIEINLLSPAFTTQGGPGCVAIQYIRKHELLK